eukprot:CAMPEP_0197643540 /NCGR_PEP_ID=MMETSP1338-20131121/16823_1 /TAXON_ID=43686 ORGANISM="Pelagodinium beii, Strain RCC1491" /NCGR_SAMPLE_ID=MMETSP1338 /ASSEMBLY_ACC=CAM_ASM_000754 /LENGTH=80 /DNA_ID=CAMNT_0043216805 /DNA_START=606 /DNA_END=844 /DNA_ORIENTATION=+
MKLLRRRRKGHGMFALAGEKGLEDMLKLRERRETLLAAVTSWHTEKIVAGASGLVSHDQGAKQILSGVSKDGMCEEIDGS